jgi:hypothetical protein
LVIIVVVLLLLLLLFGRQQYYYRSSGHGTTIPFPTTICAGDILVYHDGYYDYYYVYPGW